jgi:hypothetical protein
MASSSSLAEAVVTAVTAIVVLPDPLSVNFGVSIPIVEGGGVAPKFAPAIVTDAPIGAADGVMLVMVGPVTIVKTTPLLGVPPTVTTTLPVVVPAGTATAMLVALQLVGVAVVPLKVTVLVP